MKTRSFAEKSNCSSLLFLLLVLVLLSVPDPVCSFRVQHNSNSVSGNTIQPQQTSPMPSASTSTSTSSKTALSSSSSSSSSKAMDEDKDAKEGSAILSSMNGLSVGFLGCGTIASSIARGLARAAALSNKNESKHTKQQLVLQKIIVTERSEQTSRSLVEELTNYNNNNNQGSFSDSGFVVSRTSNHQDILDGCELIFLTVLPQQATEVLSGLEFDPNRHVLVSLVSTANLQDLVRDSKLDISRVAKMICLPSIANHDGVALLCCGGDDGRSENNNASTQPTTTTTKRFLKDLFTCTGGVVCLDTEADLEACMVTTCTMGPLYGTMLNQRDWLLQATDSRLSREDATLLVVKQFAGAISDAARDIHETRLEELIAEQTPGGLNEQALKNYGTALKGFSNLQDPVMDAVLSRIRGKTDGSIDSID